MRYAVSAFIILVLCTCLVPSFAADQPPVIVWRSGTIHDDDIEEPLPPHIVKYSAALSVSNEALELFRNAKYGQIHADYFGDELKKKFPMNKFMSLNNGITHKFGGLTSYKKRQWYFILTKENTSDIFVSIKVVHHERAVIYYRFTFFPGNLKKFVGFYIQVKQLKETNTYPTI